MTARRSARAHRSGLLTALLVISGITLTAVIASAQGRGDVGPYVPYCYSPEECPRAPYDGRFTFVRMFFDAGSGMAGFGRGRGGFGGEPPWHHDRPEAERHLSSILREITSVRAFDGITGGNVFAMDDPEIFRYPVLWVSEPGYWVPTEEEVRAVRAYLLKGGFMIFDDFDGQHMYNLVAQLQRALPELQPRLLDGSEPVWRSFFEVDPDNALLAQNRRTPPDYWGLFEDNDPTKRLYVIMNNNNDLGEFMEYSATGFAPVDVTNEAYKFAVNYIMYALTH